MFSFNLEKCTGCGACVQRCPKECISWEERELGLRYPVNNTEMCVNCGLCEKVCSIRKEPVQLVNQKAFAAVHKDSAVLDESTSGGAFTAIADAIFAMNGVVYGAAMQDGMQVEHIRIDKRDDLQKIRSSKYVQSDTGLTYQQVESDLESGRVVLYSGTPCQIDGLRQFLGKDYDSLYTADLVCHGVGSQAYFDKYMDFARKRYGKIKTLKFRSKEFSGWSCSGIVGVDSEHASGEKKIPYRDFDNYYYSYFLSGDIYRKCCYSCKYANTKRVGDFSLGDYWGVEALHLPLSTEAGCSLVLVNNERAERLFKKITMLDKVETTIEQALHCNKQLNEATTLPNSRQKRIIEYEALSGEQIQKVYMKEYWNRVVKGRIKAMMPYKLKLFVRSKRK